MAPWCCSWPAPRRRAASALRAARGEVPCRKRNHTVRLEPSTEDFASEINEAGAALPREYPIGPIKRLNTSALTLHGGCPSARGHRRKTARRRAVWGWTSGAALACPQVLPVVHADGPNKMRQPLAPSHPKRSAQAPHGDPKLVRGRSFRRFQRAAQVRISFTGQSRTGFRPGARPFICSLLSRNIAEHFGQ